MSSIKYNQILKYSFFLIILLPLVFTPFTFFPWHYGKTVIFQIVVEVMVIVFLRYRLFCHSERSPRRVGGEVEESLKVRKYLNLLDWSILIFLAVITVTSFTGVNPVNSFWGNQARANGVFTWLHFGAFYFLLKYYFKNSGRSIAKEDGKNSPPIRGGLRGGLLTIAVLVAVLVSLTSLFPQILPFTWQSVSGGGIIGNRAFLASYLVLAIGLSLYLFVSNKNKGRWLFLAAAFLFFYTILDTSNRGALLGAAAGIFSGLALCLFLARDKKIKIRSIISLFVFCSFLFALFFFNNSLTNFSFSTGTGQTRLLAWQSAWQGIKEKPFLGCGWGNYGVVFDKYYNPQFLKHSFAETVWDKPHNWLLEIGVTAGIFGVIGYLAILFSAGFYLLKKQSGIVGTGSVGTGLKPVPTNVPTADGIILFATLIAYFITNLFLFETTNSLILWFLILALVSSAIVIPAKAGIQDAPESLDSRLSPGQANFRRNDKLKRFFILFFVLLFSYLLFLNLRFLKSSYYMRQAELSFVLMDWTEFAAKALAVKIHFLPENAIFLAEQFIKFDKAGAIVKDKKIEETALKIADVLESVSSKYPSNLSFPVWAGQIYLVLGEKFDEKYYQKAEDSLLKAEKISPRKQEVLFLLGRLYLLKKDFGQALDFQKKAIAAAPEINISHWFLGLTYVAQGERAKGLEEIEKAVELGYNLSREQKFYVLDLYGLEKDYPTLIEEYKKLIENEPENVNWYIKLATVYAESGDKRAALEITRQVINLYPPIKSEAEKFIKQYQLEK